ncbi:Vacuolar sorting protein 18 [Picochlorum sp. SENEW3]|nr:Vacuolar sorting protein 18 [Picochlorum sp. SENEW3]
MALLDEWNQEISGIVAESNVSGSKNGAEATGSLFSLDIRLDFASQGRGHAVGLACSSSKIFLATSKNFLIRHDENTGSISEVMLSKSHECKIRRLFVDPCGHHILVLIQQGLYLETYYIGSDFSKPVPLKDLKGINVTSVAWGMQTALTRGAGYSSAVLGTDTGEVYAVSNIMVKKIIVERLLEIPRKGKSPISGMVAIPLGGSTTEAQRHLLLVLCGTHLHMFLGRGETVVSMLQKAGRGDVITKLFDLPIERDAAQIQLFRPPTISSREAVLADPTSFAVLSTSGIYYGGVNLRQQTDDPMDYLTSHKLLPCGVFNRQGVEQPISLAMTQYHIVLLYPSKLQFINIESRGTIQEILVESFASPMRGAAALPLGLCRDAVDGQLLVLAGDDVYEIDHSNEDRDMWKIFLSRGDYKSALPFCRTASQRNAAYLQEAERLFAEQDYKQAATLFGKCTSHVPTFDEISLRLMGLGDGAAMRAFLEARLSTLGKNDRVQSTMVSTWLLELLLDNANKNALLKNTGGVSDQEENSEDEVKAFLWKFVRILDSKTTISILEDYGRHDDLIEYARARGDDEAEVELLMRKGDAERVFEILRKPSVNRELVYKYAGNLLALAPSQTVFSWMDASPPLDPLRLLPSILPYADQRSSQSARFEVARYLKFCVEVRGVVEPAIHDFYISILCIDEKNSAELLQLIKQSKNPFGAPLYDPVRALRLCSLWQRKDAIVLLLSEVGMWNEAIDQALSISTEYAKEIASEYQGDDDDLRKGIWLKIVKHLISQEGSEQGHWTRDLVESIGGIMEDSNESVLIDDVLDLFPSLQKMGVFKSLICQNLNKYSQSIDQKKSEMRIASESNRKLRMAVSHLGKAKVRASPKSSCISCARLLTERPPTAAGPTGGSLPSIYTFPTGNMYHGACLCFEAAKLGTEQSAAIIKKLSKQLALAKSTSEVDTIVRLKAELEKQIAVQDPFCSENLAMLVTKPFTDDSCSERATSWSIK